MYLLLYYLKFWASLVIQTVKNPPTMDSWESIWDKPWNPPWDKKKQSITQSHLDILTSSSTFRKRKVLFSFCHSSLISSCSFLSEMFNSFLYLLVDRYLLVLGSIPGLGRLPRGGHNNPLQYSCLENPHGQKSLVGYSPWGHKESDKSEWLSTQPIIYFRCYSDLKSGY